MGQMSNVCRIFNDDVGVSNQTDPMPSFVSIFTCCLLCSGRTNVQNWQKSAGMLPHPGILSRHVQPMRLAKNYTFRPGFLQALQQPLFPMKSTVPHVFWNVHPQYSYLSLGCSKKAEQCMLNYARSLVGKPFSNVGMARSIVFPRRTDGESFFCAGTLNTFDKKMLLAMLYHDVIFVRRTRCVHFEKRGIDVRRSQ